MDEDPRHPFVTRYCKRCQYEIRFRISCGDRTCPECRKKWFGYHYKTLHDLVKTWPVIHSLTLTIQNIPDEVFSKSHVKEIRDSFTRLRKEFKQIKGGFYVVQATNQGKGWHLHLHIIFDGAYIAKSELKAAWYRITSGSYILAVSDVKRPDKAIRYLLADFSGAPRIRPEDTDLYNFIFKGSRLVQPFGKYRGIKFRVGYRCPKCGGTVWVTIGELLTEPPVFHPSCKGQGP